MVILNQHFYENKLTFILIIAYYILKVEMNEKNINKRTYTCYDE